MVAAGTPWMSHHSGRECPHITVYRYGFGIEGLLGNMSFGKVVARSISRRATGVLRRRCGKRPRKRWHEKRASFVEECCDQCLSSTWKVPERPKRAMSTHRAP
jgi:hypothetical protein